MSPRAQRASAAAVLFTDAFAAGLVMPHLPGLIDKLAPDGLDTGARLLVLAALFAGQALLGPAWAQMARLVSWPVIGAAGFAAFAAGLQFLTLNAPFPVMLFALALPGLSVATTITALSAIGRTYPDHARSRGQGLGFALVAAGFVAGPIVSGIAPFHSVEAVLRAAGLVCLTGLFVCIAALITGAGPAGAAPERARRSQRPTPRADAPLLAGATAAALLAASSQPFTLMWPLVGGEALQLGPRGIGLSFAAITALTALFNILLIGRLDAAAPRLLAAGLAGIALLYAAAGMLTAPALFAPLAIAVALISCAPALLSGRALRACAVTARSGAFETVNTVFFLAGAGGSMFGATVTFLLYDRGWELGAHSVSPPFLVSAGLVAAALFVLKVSPRTAPASRTA